MDSQFTKKIAIRVCTNSNFGKGHITRCLAIGSHIKCKIIWFIDCLDDDIIKMIPVKDEIIIEDNIRSCEKVKKAIEEKNVNLVLLDSYHISKNDQFQIKKNIPLAVISDSIKKLNADLVIYPHPVSRNFKKNKKYLVGLKYAPIAKKFVKKYRHKKYNKKEFNILVSMGSMDKKGVTVKAIKALNRMLRNHSYKFKVIIILGDKSPLKLHVVSLINQLKNYKVLINPDDMGIFYSKSSLAIGAPGQSHLERLIFGLPTILVAQNKIHKLLIPKWEKLGCSIKAENSVSSLYRSLEYLFSNQMILKKMKKRSNYIVDGLGASRVASNLLEMF